MKFTLTIKTGNAAFDEDDRSDSIDSALREVAAQVLDGYQSGYIRDYNGHNVGSWELEV